MPAEHPRTGIDGRGTLALLGAMGCMIAVPLLLRYLTVHVDVWWQNALRFSVAVLFWLPFLIGRARRGQVDRRVWTLALIPLAGNLGQQILYAATVYYIQPALMSLLLKSSVVWIMVFSMALFPDERALARSPRLWLGLLLCAGGILGVTLFKEGLSTRGTLIGVAMALVSALCWGVYSVTARLAFRDIDSRLAFSVLSLYTTVVLLVLAFVFGDASAIARLSAPALGAIVGSAILGIALGHVFYYTAVKRIGGTISSLVGLAGPFLVLAVSYLAFGETLNARQWVSGLVLVVGAAVALLSQKHLGRRPRGEPVVVRR